MESWDGARERSKRLRADTEQQRIRLIESEFTFAVTFCDLAETEARIGNPEHARRLVAKIRQAIATARHQLAQASISKAQCDEISDQLEGVESRLREVLNQVALP